MWIRFKKRAKPGYTKYHSFSGDRYISDCLKEVRRDKGRYGKERSTTPRDLSLVCTPCHQVQRRKKESLT